MHAAGHTHSESTSLTPRIVVATHWPELADAPVVVVAGGLINHTWTLGAPPSHVLQWVSPIFDPRIHSDIDAVTRRLVAIGITTPRLVPARGGSLWIDDSVHGCWRVQTYIAGRTLHQLPSTEAAVSCGRLVGSFHSALEDWSYRFQAPRRAIHDTPARMEELEAALARLAGNPLEPDIRQLGERVLAAWRALEPAPQCPLRYGHGDLKVSNIRFSARSDEAVALIDLDTVGPLPVPVELGDAWRSWCNPAGEDRPETTRFSLELFESALRGWCTTGPGLSPDERAALVPTIETICLELSARFCTDAVDASYFREDRGRFPVAGSHNLHRGRCQLALAESLHRQRAQAERIVATTR